MQPYQANDGQHHSWREKAPVFVLGCPRSGTTYLYDAILSSGNFAVFLAESEVFSLVGAAFGSLKSETNRRKMVDVWLQSDHFKRSGLNADELREEVISNCRSGGDFLRIVMERIAERQGVARWADNTPSHLLYMPQIKAAFPNALFIHILRDGRDNATSAHRIGWQADYGRFPWDRRHGLLVSAALWDWMVQKGRKFGRSLGADYLEVRYEDLVEHPRETFKVLGEFIHHDLDYDRIQQNALGTVRKPNSSFTATAGTKNGPSQNHGSSDSFKPIGRWKQLKDPDTERMEAMLAPRLAELGYDFNRSARIDFTAWRIRVFYHFYREIKHMLKSGPFGEFFVARDRLKPGYLDRKASYWKSNGSEQHQGKLPIAGASETARLEEPSV